jgi:hypothetical protein
MIERSVAGLESRKKDAQGTSVMGAHVVTEKCAMPRKRGAEGTSVNMIGVRLVIWKSVVGRKRGTEGMSASRE